MKTLTLNPDQAHSLECRLAQLQSLGLLLTHVSTMESQKVELTTLADLGRVIVYLAEATQDELLQSSLCSTLSES